MIRAFEPERSWPDAIESGDAESFLDREVGVQCEQGNFEQARQRLARRVIAREDDAEAYLDAIRLERSAAPSGTAWQAWAARALSQGVQVAPALFALLPRAELAAFLAKTRVRWTNLEKQRDGVAARELMRMRLELQLEHEPDAALMALEDPGFVRRAETDPRLRQLALGVLAGAVFHELARVFELAPQYGVDWNAQPDAADPFAPLLAQLLLAFRLQPAFAAVTGEVGCPAALDRFLRVAAVTSAAQAERFAHELSADLRAQRREYLSCADCVVRTSAPLAQFWLDALHAMRDELIATRAARTDDDAPPRSAGAARTDSERSADESAAAAAAGDALDRSLSKLRTELRSDPLQRLWWGALALNAAALALGGASLLLARPALGHGASIGGLTGAVVLLPLRGTVDALLYRRNVRPTFFEAIAARGIAAATLVSRMRQVPLPRRSALAARAERDTGLLLLSAIGELEDATARLAGQVRS